MLRTNGIEPTHPREQLLYLLRIEIWSPGQQQPEHRSETEPRQRRRQRLWIHELRIVVISSLSLLMADGVSSRLRS